MFFCLANAECITPMIKQTAGGNVLTHMNSFKSNKHMFAEKPNHHDELQQPPLSPKLYKMNVSAEKQISSPLKRGQSMNAYHTSSRNSSDENKKFRPRVSSTGSPRRDGLKKQTVIIYIFLLEF